MRKKKKQAPAPGMNFAKQEYKGIVIRLIDRYYGDSKAKRFTLGGTNQNVWIPNKHLQEDGTIIPGENLDYIFRKAQNQLKYAGYHQPIPGIKRGSGPYARPSIQHPLPEPPPQRKGE